jgi:Protein of unknown function (DUF2889)
VLVIPDRAGPARPVTATPRRPAGSLRRTTSIDSSRHDGLDGNVSVDGRARDLRTDHAGDATSHDARLRATIAPDRTLLEIAAEPPEPRLSELVGARVGGGFRARVNGCLPDIAEARTLLHALLDDMPGAALVSGYALQRGGSALIPTGGAGGEAFRQHILSSEDMCAGWASSGSILVAFREHETVPTPMGPPAPDLDRQDDPLAWHAMAPLPDAATRRRRRLDLVPSADAPSGWTFDSHFRDSYRDEHGAETVLHEYLVDGWLEEGGPTIGGARAEARVLPWVECPAAIASAGRMAGRPLAELRREVRTEFVGTGTCTHLNDMFRFLSDLLPLLGMADSPAR